MRRLAPILLLLVAALAQAQENINVLVLPFDASGAAPGYGLGLATGLERSLNVLDGVYAPPLGDAALFVRRAFDAGQTSVRSASEAFAADAVISAGISGTGETLAATLVLSGPRFPESREQQLQLPADPAAAVTVLAEAAAAALGISDAAELEQLRSVAAETPSLASLDPVAQASSRLGADLSALAAAAQLDPESSWVLSEQARAVALAGDPEAALNAASRAVEANPQDIEAQVVRGIVAGAARRPDVAQASFEAALRLNPGHALALAGAAGLESDPARSRVLLERAVAAYPRLVEAQLALAELEESDQRALQQLRLASQSLPESIALHRAFLQRALGAGDVAGALAYLRQVAADPLAVSPALYALAAGLPGEVAEEALGFVAEGREAFPDSVVLQLAEAELLQRLGRVDEALARLEALHGAHPEDVDVANRLAVALAEQGEVERARTVFESVAGESETVQLNLAQLLLSAGQARAAAGILETLLTASPDDADVHALYGVALGRSGRTTAAIAALDRALELDPEHDLAQRARSLLEQQQSITGGEEVTFEGEAAAAFEEGLTALEENDTKAAAAAFARLRELADHPLAAFYHGYALQRSGRVRDAAAAYETARDGYPESDTVLNNLGYAQLQLGRFDLALATLREAASVGPDNPQVHLNLGLTFYGLGRYDDALASWDRALELDPALEDDLAEIRAAAAQNSSR